MSRLDLATVRARLAAADGRRYWKSLEELAETPEFRELLEREFPQQAAAWPRGVSRRTFLSLMGASLALAGLSGCSMPPGEKIVPYVRQPEEVVPGNPLYFATAMSLGGVATGVLVESHEGRPTKVEGNPDHPASRGATGLFAQASILDLYDPDRSTTVTYQQQPRLYADFVQDVRAALGAQRAVGGSGLRVLTTTVGSPTLGAQLAGILAALPKARWHQWEPCSPGQGARAGALLAFGRPVSVHPRLDRADVVLALDADFLAPVPRNLRAIGDFAARRRVAGQARPAMNRLYAVEPCPSCTGGVADHRLPLRAADVAGFAMALAARLGVDVRALAPVPPAAPPAAWLDAVARDLAAHRGRSLVLAGEGQPALVHALAHAINEALGGAGRTVLYADPVEAASVDQAASLRELVADMRAGRVQVLMILGGNPVYTAPADLDFGGALMKVALPVHLGLHVDETAVKCRWHVPEAHYLETWSDARAADGTVSLVQPLIAPLYAEAKSAHEVLAVFTDSPTTTGYEMVRAHWQRGAGADFERAWRKALHDGVVPDTALPGRPLRVDPRWAERWRASAARTAAAAPPPGSLEIVFRPSPHVWDGRFANNGWLQELPQPLTKITWDNAVLLAPATAERLGVSSEDVVEVAYRGRTVRGPAWVLPGHAPDSITMHLGYGRTLAGRVGNGVGFDAGALRTSDALWFDGGATLGKTGARTQIASTVTHHSMNGRDIVVAGTLGEYEDDPAFSKARVHERHVGEGGRPLTLYPEFPSTGYAWGMVIDLSACIGCGACETACYAENNIPVVGKTQVRLGRIMHWIRIDSYYTGGLDNPDVYHQAVPCMHCEDAPCEVVCPVAATTHSREGLNEMIYNRCVGTRYCSNNCPYKVRRFNFLQYADWSTPSLKLQRNPEVTVRSRGVMEKCTYCVQRISRARIAAERTGRRIVDGEVVPACAAACPAQAIVFGDLNDPSSRVRKLKASGLNYALLGDLGTRPRTTYLAAVRNPNPELRRA